ncbi:MAG: helix-turn-helix domain-containing protein [Oscillospiraceae bacterium]|nr:helix-turn-helix domain-containing protein [Oscillospiraceae bacterium]
MDAKTLGAFIVGRRKELGLTQMQLAEQLHVTDKAVSRWERGVGLPDINSIEPLAKALDVSLVEIMQAKKNDDTLISAQDAEKLVADTIQFSRTTHIGIKIVGSLVLTGFTVVIFLLFIMISSYGGGYLGMFSISCGLIAWGIPIWCLSFGRYNTGLTASMSFTPFTNAFFVYYFRIVFGYFSQKKYFY